VKQSALKMSGPSERKKSSLKRGCCNVRRYSEWQQKIKRWIWSVCWRFFALPVISGHASGIVDSSSRDAPAQADAAKQNKNESETFHAIAYLYESDEVSRPTVVVSDNGQSRKLFLNAFAYELVDELCQPPLPLPPLLQGKGEGKIPGGRVTQGSSFLATAGLICETRFGVFKMAQRKLMGL
jgi:hypothetical protein